MHCNATICQLQNSNKKVLAVLRPNLPMSIVIFSIRRKHPFDFGSAVSSPSFYFAPLPIIFSYRVFLDEEELAYYKTRLFTFCYNYISTPLDEQLFLAYRPYQPCQNGCTCLISESFTYFATRYTISHHSEPYHTSPSYLCNIY